MMEIEGDDILMRDTDYLMEIVFFLKTTTFFRCNYELT